MPDFYLKRNIFTSSSSYFLCPPSTTVTVVPAAPIPQYSTLRLIASVNPDFAITKITWVAPGGLSMKSEKKLNTGTVAKLPQIQTNDNGAYVCMVHPWGNSSNSLFAFNVDVTVDGETDLRERKAKALRNRRYFLLCCVSGHQCQKL